jgi:hypothetical protein
MLALKAQTIQRIDEIVEKHLPNARQAHPESQLRQYRWLRDLILEDVPEDEAGLVAMQCDHYFFCLCLNSGADIA